MSGELTPVERGEVALLHKLVLGGGGLSPYAREIFLVECHVAGTSFVPAKEIEPTLSPGGFLVFRREPENHHDPLAIRIVTETGQALGYVPRDRNEILARLMDAGKFVFGRIEEKTWKSEWLRVNIRVFLRES